MENDNNIVVTKTMLNEIILESLLIDGYANIAAVFAEEADLEVSSSALESAQKRSEIIASITHKRLDKLITNSVVLHCFPLSLQFRLHAQFVIDELEQNRTVSAWKYFTRTFSSWKSMEPENQKILEDITLLFLQVPTDEDNGANVFSSSSSSSSDKRSKLFSVNHRQELIRSVNEYLLRTEGLRTTSRLPLLLRIFLHYQETQDSESDKTTDQHHPQHQQRKIFRKLITGGVILEEVEEEEKEESIDNKTTESNP